jgi:hypothetical protein
MNIDKQRINAVRMLQALGYTYQRGEWLLTYRGAGGGEWLAPAGAEDAATPLSLMARADAMHGAWMRRADELAGCTDGSDEEAELEAIIDAIEAYEAKRWPLGKDPNALGGKG